MDDTTSWHWTSGQPRLNPQYCAQGTQQSATATGLHMLQMPGPQPKAAKIVCQNTLMQGHRMLKYQLYARLGLSLWNAWLWQCGWDGLTWTA